ncbi:hypothetical protein AB4Z18_04880 [Leifsonia sp. 2TAF2]|uniref:hypothetical protein n=1 Tax=Leifsonia sp. 2TAF2 TaxID=3233009 RepID=UPI003F944891
MTLEPGSFIWATRGRRWGFRFLRDGGYDDPLPVYEAAFAGLTDRREVCQQADEAIILRFPDPDGRQDHSRRIISHDFVIRPTSSGQLPAVEDAPDIAWATVSADYAQLWDADPAD